MGHASSADKSNESESVIIWASFETASSGRDGRHMDSVKGERRAKYSSIRCSGEGSGAPLDAATDGARPAGQRSRCYQRSVGDDAGQPGRGEGTPFSLSQSTRVRRVVSDRAIHLRPSAKPQLHGGVPERAVLGRPRRDCGKCGLCASHLTFAPHRLQSKANM